MPTPVVYYTTIATSPSGLSVPMSIGPTSVEPIPPDEIFTASGYRKLNGLDARLLTWIITNPQDSYDIFTRTGGTGATSIFGAIRCRDLVSRDPNYETYSDWTCYLDQPIKTVWKGGVTRTMLQVKARRLVLIQQLPATV